MNRRDFLGKGAAAAGLLCLRPAALIGFQKESSVSATAVKGPIQFEEIAAKSGLHFVTANCPTSNKNQIETMPGGVGVLDYDRDGYLDVYVVNGAAIPTLQKESPQYWNRLFHNNHDGTFTDVTEKAGVAGSGYGMGVAVGDYDNDGYPDLFVANVASNQLFRNNGDGTFTDVSESSGILQANGTFGLGVLTADFDNDGWPDVYVANDSMASALYQNRKNGKFTDIAIEAGCALSSDGKPQAGMGVSAADYDLDGNLDILKTNFAGDTPSLYRNLGGANFEDTTFAAGLGLHTQYLGWGCGFVDFDNDGWPDILICNGHVYPEVEQLKTEAGYAQRKLLYRNSRNGRFEDVSYQAGDGISTPAPSRGAAFGDYDNDGDIDVVVNAVNDFPQLLRCDSHTGNNWIKVRTIGSKSNRSGIGSRLKCVTRPAGEGKAHEQIDEVRSGGGYFSQSDLRVHFGIGKAEKVELLEVRWPSGLVDILKDIKPNQLIFVKEGEGIVRSMKFDAAATRR